VDNLTDEAKAEIAAAIAILREDGLHVHRTYKQFLASQEVKDDEPGEGDPPPVKEEPVPVSEKKAKRRGIGVWGATE